MDSSEKRVNKVVESFCSRRNFDPNNVRIVNIVDEPGIFPPIG